MAKITENSTLADIVTIHPQTRMLLEDLSLDYCCGGKRTLKDACQKAELSPKDVIKKIEDMVEKSPASKEAKDWSKTSLTELADHINDVHHNYLKQQFPRLERLIDKVYKAHKQHHGEMLEKLRNVLDSLRTDIEMHLAKEEQILFPMIKEIEAYVEGSGPMPIAHCGTVANPTRQMEHEHDVAGDLLARMREITNDYQLPEDACQTFKGLYEGLRDLEKDLHCHIHLENNILFPRAIETESKMRV